MILLKWIKSLFCILLILVGMVICKKNLDEFKVVKNRILL